MVANMSTNRKSISALYFLCSLRICSIAQRWHEKRSMSLCSHFFFDKEYSLSALPPMGIYWECTQEKRVTRHGSQIELALMPLVDVGMHTHAFGREHHAACVHDYFVPDLGDMTCSLCDLL